jgi:hypothetical protein
MGGGEVCLIAACGGRFGALEVASIGKVRVSSRPFARAAPLPLPVFPTRRDMHGRRNCLRRLAALAGLLTPSWLTSCGALIHPERVGQPRTGRLDPSIVLLDGLGLLLFLVPGVIAFIVDFATGAIYMPPDYYGLNDDPERTADGLVKIPVEGPLTRERIEAAIARASGKKVELKPGTYRAEPVPSVDEYSTAVALLETRTSHAEVIFRCQSP